MEFSSPEYWSGPPLLPWGSNPHLLHWQVDFLLLRPIVLLGKVNVFTWIKVDSIILCLSVYLVVYHLPIYVPICHLCLISVVLCVCMCVCVCVCVCMCLCVYKWVMMRSIRSAIYLEDQSTSPQHSIRSGIFPEGWIIHSGSCPEKGMVPRQKVGITWVMLQREGGSFDFSRVSWYSGPVRYPVHSCWWGGFHWESYCFSGHFEEEQRAISQLLFNISTLVIRRKNPRS